MKNSLSVAVLVLLAALFGSPDAVAQSAAYPSRTVRIIVPFPPGQATDIIGRLVAQGLAEKWGHPVVVENRAGAGGMLGTDQAAKAQGDGYTLLVAGSGPLSILPSINSNLPYSPLKDFQPLALVASMPMVLAMAPSHPAQTLNDVISMVRGKPGEISYASSGTGSTGQLAAELMLSLTQTKMIHVPYKGSGAALSDVMSGLVPVTVESQAATMPLITSGKLRAIAMTSKKRSGKFPAVPTFDESGLPGFDVVAWIGVIGQSSMPAALQKKISADLAQIMESAEIRRKIEDMGLEAAPMGPEQFTAHLRQEIEKYTALAKSANIKAE